MVYHEMDEIATTDHLFMVALIITAIIAKVAHDPPFSRIRPYAC